MDKQLEKFKMNNPYFQNVVHELNLQDRDIKKSPSIQQDPLKALFMTSLI